MLFRNELFGIYESFLSEDYLAFLSNSLSRYKSAELELFILS